MFDLHFHSTESDGAASFETVVAAAAAHHELARLALTDHDSIVASSRLTQIDDRAWVGAELTSFTGRRRIDLLALGVRPDDRPLLDYLARRVTERRDRFALFGELLRGDGWAFDPPAEVWARPQLASPHVVAEIRRQQANHERLTEMGIPLAADIGSGDPIYDRLLDPLGPEVRRRTESAVLEGPAAIAMIRRAGGLAIVAHPWISPYDRGEQTRSKARRLLMPLVEAGLDGLELWHSDQLDESVQAELRRFADEHGLLVSGGSDDHTVDLRYLGQPTLELHEAARALEALETGWRARQTARPR